MARPSEVTRVRVVGVVAVLALVLAGAACGAGDPPAGSEKVVRPSAVGDCLRPDPDRAGGFLQADCEGAGATVEIVDVVGERGSGARCPAGTDALADAAAGPVSGGKIEGTAAVWCLRNLEAPHPGDPGMGGGELAPGDCFVLAEEAAEGRGPEVTEVPCAGGGEAPEFRLVASATRSEDCPASGAEPIELSRPRLTVLCAEALGQNGQTGPTG
jgi:hypothetical protein